MAGDFGENIWSESFKELFAGMTEMYSCGRWTLEDIKFSDWYSGEIYSKEELKEVMLEKLSE